jgi:hypothetical protein
MNRGLAGSLIVAVVLVTTICCEAGSYVGWVPGDMPVRSPVAGVQSVAPATDPAEVAQGWVSVALERPLFRANRRPDAALDHVTLRTDASARLAGVITGGFGNRAIFMPAADAKPVIVKAGDRIANLVVRSIEPGRVVVESGGGIQTLKPSFR